MTLILRVACAIILVIPTIFSQSYAAADSYPTKPITLIIPFPPGGGLDIVGRLLAEQLGKEFGQSVIVENRSGAAGTIGMSLAAKAAPDGYSIVMGSVGPIAFAPSLYKQLPYDPLKDFAPVALVAILPNVLLANPSAPFKTVQELIIQAKAKPGSLNYGSAGSGTPPHLAMEMFKAAAGINLTHIPYKGGPPALNDLMGGRIQVMFINVLSALPLIKAKRLTALAVSTPERSDVLPDVPTMTEAAHLPGFSANDWFGILAPADTPRPIIDRLNAALVKVLARPDIKSRLSQQGAQAVTDTPLEFGAFIRSEIERWGKIIRIAHVEAN